MTGEINAETFGKKIRRLRNHKHWSQNELAAKSGLSQSELSRIETGHFRGLNEETIKRLSGGLGITPEILLQDTRKPISAPRLLRIFLCHSLEDKPAVRSLYQHLCADNFSPWLDEEDLDAGQEWDKEIPRAVRDSDVVLVCLSRDSINKKGYAQKEIKFALDVADEQPEGTVYIIPIKLEECDVPERLRRWHWINLYETNGYEKLVRSLKRRAGDLGIDTIELTTVNNEEGIRERLYDDDIALEADTHIAFPCELDEGEGMTIDLRSSAPVDVLIMDENSYQDWKNNKAMDTLLRLLYKEYLGRTELRTFYSTHKWRRYLLIVRNQQVDKVKVQLKIDRKK